MIPMLAGLSPSLALEMEAVLLTALAGKTLGQGCLNASGGGGRGSAGRTLAGASCGGLIGGSATEATHGPQMRNGGLACGGGKGKGGGNKEGRGVGKHPAAYTGAAKTQANYLAYCASAHGKANMAKRGLSPVPAHYSGLLKLTPSLHFMNASGKNKARITNWSQQSKT
jgi:hypothetical protein